MLSGRLVSIFWIRALSLKGKRSPDSVTTLHLEECPFSMTGLLKKESGFPEARFNYPWSKCAGGCGSCVVTWDGYRVFRQGGRAGLLRVCVQRVLVLGALRPPHWGPRAGNQDGGWTVFVGQAVPRPQCEEVRRMPTLLTCVRSPCCVISGPGDVFREDCGPTSPV